MPHNNPDPFSHKPHNRLVYEADPIPDDDNVHNAVAVHHDQPRDRRQQTFEYLGSIFEYLEQSPPQGGQNSTASSTTVTPGGRSTTGGMGSSSGSDPYYSGHGPSYYGDYNDPVERIRQMLWKLLRDLDHFIFIAKAPSGGLIGAFHLPKRMIAMIVLAMFMIFATLYNFPGIWEIIFGIFGLA
jgi:hypothetical protein